MLARIATLKKERDLIIGHSKRSLTGDSIIAQEIIKEGIGGEESSLLSTHQKKTHRAVIDH